MSTDETDEGASSMQVRPACKIFDHHDDISIRCCVCRHRHYAVRGSAIERHLSPEI